MDEQQKRVGSVTALVAQGDKPASSLPAPQAAPVIHAAKPPSTKPPETMPEAVRQAAAKADCDEPATADPIKGKLDERTTLWGVLCSRGAYKYTYAFYLHRTGARTAAPVVFETPALHGAAETDNQLTNPDFDDRAMTLSFFGKGRGLGDCGSLGRFVWDGRSFQLAAFSAMGSCRGVPLTDWPRAWRADVR
jgi:Protein of unknown function (DUF1176)